MHIQGTSFLSMKVHKLLRIFFLHAGKEAREASESFPLIPDQIVSRGFWIFIFFLARYVSWRLASMHQ